jgi:predicted Fe-Mo cluster-binding NifX family protein
MKAAFSVWNNRVAPVFDVARQIHVVEAESGRIVAETQEVLGQAMPAQKARRLADLGVEILICGAISRGFQALVGAYGVRVVPFIAGDLHDVIGAWMTGRLKSPLLAMPGCWGRRHRCKGGLSMRTKDGSRQMSAGGGMGRGRRRGQGGQTLGRMGGPFALGAGGVCVCPQCGHEEPHERGVPCLQKVCAKCGANMIRKQQR